MELVLLILLIWLLGIPVVWMLTFIDGNHADYSLDEAISVSLLMAIIWPLDAIDSLRLAWVERKRSKGDD